MRKHPLRMVLGRFATGVTIVTAAGDSGPIGLTANSFTSVSLDPAIVLVCLDACSRSGQAITRCDSFVVNFLRRDQRRLSETFARPGPDRFAGLPTRPGRAGAPVIEGSLGHVDCRVDETLVRGDHLVLFGAVLEAAVTPEAVDDDPLIFYAGQYL
ncbi:flavin reductase family protein [Kribbella sp. NPDC058245]|uniref:flavin reductase family protein n=1 Tax=Kribbella sp. NPDC058245 TaxID=3346399 RepID=UPI0036E71CFD